VRSGGIFAILSRCDVEELLEERGLNVDHTTVWRWVQDYGPELEQRLRRHLKPTNKFRDADAAKRLCLESPLSTNRLIR
jgi:hypothetical protein